MLDKRRRAQQQTAKAYAPRRKCNLYFTIILGTALIIFVLTLVQLHNRSAADVSSGAHKPEPKPPPWEDFPRLQRYFGGLRSLVSPGVSRPEYPGNEQDVIDEVVEALANATLEEDLFKRKITSQSYHVGYESENESGPAAPCFLDSERTLLIPRLSVYKGEVEGFPQSAVGLQDLVSENKTTCLDRFGRLAPYGFGYSQAYGGSGAGLNGDLEGVEEMRSHQREIDYRSVRWSKAQSACHASNKHRYLSQQFRDINSLKSNGSSTFRNVVLVRKEWEQEFTIEEILALRALISEASLATGGVFSVHFLVQFRDETIDIWSNQEAYNRILDESLPEEFQGMGSLWTEQLMRSVYGELEATTFGNPGIFNDEHTALMSVQHFANQHPEFDFFWTWDISTRSTGHIGRTLSQLDTWSRKQPRKELWERSARFFLPSEHGSWEDFVRMVHILAEHGSNQDAQIFQESSAKLSSASSKSVWGPVTPTEGLVNSSYSVQATTSQSSDTYKWGIDEAADLLTLAPIFDPTSVTSWAPATDVVGYNLTSQYPPRRASIGSTFRMSRRLLLAMHTETAQAGRHMAAEMWPASVALHYGLKAVFVPHANYVDRKWPTDYLAAILNSGADGGVIGGRSSVFGDARRGVLDELTWGSDGKVGNFPRRLWRRWLGYRDEVTGDGGEEWEINGEGRMCLPPMLLGGVRDVNLVIE